MRIIFLILTVSALLFGAYTRDDAMQTVYDNDTKFIWQDNSDVNSSVKTWSDAIDYCEKLNFAGYVDWRLPNKNELFSIMDFRQKLTINSVFQFVGNNYQSSYWSSTTSINDVSFAWAIEFEMIVSNIYIDNKNVEYQEKNKVKYVRCIRDGQMPLQMPPIIEDIPNQTATQNINFSLDISTYVTLTNGDAVSLYTLTGTLPTGMSFNTTTGLLSGTPSETGTFNFSVTATDNDGVSNSDSFTLMVEDMDSDGVTELPGVDGNHNGTEDRFEDNVASLSSGTNSITLAVQGSASVNMVSTSSTYNAGQRSDGTQIYFPYGTVSFTVSGLSNGGTANIELFYPYNENIEGYAKQFADGFWHDVGATVTHNSTDAYTKVTFSIVDGSSFDLDGIVNGEVQDPGGAYSLTLFASNAVSVPLSASAKAALALLFVLGGLLFMRKEKWVSS